jgi:hypothetical protein
MVSIKAIIILKAFSVLRATAKLKNIIFNNFSRLFFSLGAAYSLY